MKLAKSFRRWVLLMPVLAGCSLVTVADPYGNTYGDWRNHGSQYSWQLSTCEQQVAVPSIPPHDRKLAMRCCMWRNGVPIEDPQSCHAATG